MFSRGFRNLGQRSTKLRKRRSTNSARRSTTPYTSPHSHAESSPPLAPTTYVSQRPRPASYPDEIPPSHGELDVSQRTIFPLSPPRNGNGHSNSMKSKPTSTPTPRSQSKTPPPSTSSSSQSTAAASTATTASQPSQHASTSTADVQPLEHPEEIRSPGRHKPLAPFPKYTATEFIGKTGGEIFHEMMRRNGVKHMFGHPGGAILPVFDAIYNSPQFDFILTRHEQGAGHMAEGYARATGKCGVALVTSGPGATNTVTPLMDAQMDGTPIVVFAGQVPTNAIGTDAFQEANMLEITKGCTKAQIQVKDTADFPRAINEAFYIAMSGRPGPVFVDLPKNVTAGKLEKPAKIEPTIEITEAKEPDPLTPEQEKAVTRAADMINKAERPILYAGNGVIQSDSCDLLRAISQKGGIPCTTTLLGLGAFDQRSPLSLNMIGMHGHAAANMATQDADVIVAIGSRFDDRITGAIPQFAPMARKASMEGRGGVIHMDVLASQIDKIYKPTTVPLQGDCAQFMDALLPQIKQNDRDEWRQKFTSWKNDYPLKYEKSPDILKCQQVLESFDQATMPYKDKLIVTTGVGAHQMWAAQYLTQTNPRSFITSGGAGTMGYGVPSAIGAKVACPEKIVVDIDGDGSFSMTCMELATAVENNINVKILLMNNNFLGMVKQWQDLFYQERYAATVMQNPSFSRMVEAMGVKPIYVSREEDLEGAMREFIEYDQGPVMLEALICEKEHVYPMVVAGAALHDMVMGPGQSKVTVPGNWF